MKCITTEKSRAPQSAGALLGAGQPAPCIGTEITALGSLLGTALRLFHQLQLGWRSSAGLRRGPRARAQPSRLHRPKRPKASWPWAPPRGKSAPKGGGRRG